MVMSKSWKQDDSKFSKLVALATQVKELQERLKSNQQSSSNSSDSSMKPSCSSSNVEPWHLTKSLGDSVHCDGKEWHWCSKQHNNGKGMYVRHKEEDHLGWNANKKSNKSKPSNNQSTTSSKSNLNDSKPSMTLSDNLKAAMVSQFRCTESDADKLWSEVVQKN
jgi:hypothetical protein